ncbi:MAG: Extracellular nuclease [uncultured Aureispira sp.]|uniref:Extracellular nuclease n=1 Tax=uncultured Aureispira sp. TaxID=1331704 RepID=A0A6S6U928_9BACT|nr:MAG: Extracellular nuclease [uncultured Aureispira sp.]
MKARYFNFSAFLLLVTLLAFSACKKEFDEPPISELPNLVATATIADVIALASTSPVALGDQVLEATVIADDKSGNFYKQLVIQDSTAGLRIDIDAFSIYNDFPIGRKVWIKCKGLFIWRDGDVVALVGSDNTNNSRLPQSTYRQFIIGGEYNKPVTPKLKTLSTLTSADYNTLIQLDNVEFADCFAGSSYAYASTQESKNAELTECSSGGNVIVRNSGFATFANLLMPTENGSIIAVFNSFSGTSQLFIRDPNDVSSMTDTRCVSLANYASVSMQDLRAQFSGSAATAVGKVRGIVISDPNTGQWQSRNVVIQEPNGSGMTFRFDDDHSFALGDYVEVKVGGATVDEFNGLLQVNNLPLCRATALPNPGGIVINPRVTTVADITANANAWESTLVNVPNSNLNGGTTYGDFGIMLNDATGSMGLFSGFSTFGSAPIPTGTGDVTAVVGDYNGIQLNIRNLSDVNITGGGTGTGGTNFNQISIQDARNLFTGAAVTAPDTTKIVGIVISDLVGGNWVDQNVVIQEQGGAGITVRFDAAHSFNLGDEIEVKISQLSIEEFNGLLQINGVPLANATVLSSGNAITPRVATVADITANANAWESTLVNVQTATLNGGTTYGDFGIMLNDATGSISMFSAFSNFTGTAIPTGTGDVTGVVGDYNGTQINIRNTSDVNISGGGTGGGPTTFITIGAARALFSGSATTAPASTSIAGIVISDKDNENITDRNLVLQQTGGSGIIVRFAAANTTLSVGDSITVDISGGDISEFNGLLQVSNIPNANAVVASSGNLITPRVATVADILANAETWESTLVVINGATITGATTYSGTTTVADASAAIDMYTRPGATFSLDNVPAGSVNVTAIVSQFTGYQLNIRNTTDVQ